MRLHTDGLYAIMVLTIRGVASALFKQIFLYILLRKKKFRLNKPKMNLIFVSIPSIILYLVIALSRSYSSEEWALFLEENAIFFFMMFMVCSKIVRSFNKIIKNKQKRVKKKYKRKTEKKKEKKALKKLLKEQEDHLKSNNMLSELSTDADSLSEQHNLGKDESFATALDTI
jgi:hypothetical protein